MGSLLERQEEGQGVKQEPQRWDSMANAFAELLR